MKVKTTVTFMDGMLDRVINVGEELDLEDRRGQYLIDIGYAKKIKGGDSEWSYQSEATESKESKSKGKTGPY